MRATALVSVCALAALTGCSSPSTDRTPTRSSATGSDSGLAVSLPATPALRVALREAYVAARPGIRLKEVAGPRHGTLYYAFDRMTRTYWAIAWFDPSSHARQATAAKFQFGMGAGIFTRTVSGKWHAKVQVRSNLPCPNEVPAPVLEAWHIKAGTCTM
jgi:hypothetical protein